MNKNIKHFLVTFLVSAICLFGTSLFLLSSCSVLGSLGTDDTYAAHGYHFAAKDMYGQTLCYEFLNDNEVALVIPSNSGSLSEFKLPENVIVPKTIKYYGKNYTVSALYSLNNSQYGSSFNRKGTYEIRCKNLVIPETVKVICFSCSSMVQNIIYYGDSSTPVIKYFSKGLCEKCLQGSPYTYDQYKKAWDAKGKKEYVMRGKSIGQNDSSSQCFLHVMPSYSAGFTTDKNKYRVVSIVDNYNIYEEGHSLEEYLKISKGSVDQVKNREKYKNGLWVPSPNGMVLCFKKIENSNEVELYDIVLEKGEVDSLIVPQTITDYDNNTYTVTSVDELANRIYREGFIPQYWQKYVVLPETVKRYNTGHGRQREREIICYSPDMEINAFYVDPKYEVYHFPQGCANRIMKEAGELFTCLEIVDDYDIYQEGNSLAEYIEKSRAAVKKAKEDYDAAARAALAAEKAAEEKKAAEWRAKQEAEAKRIRKELTSQYGAKYVNDLFNNGKLVIGMPIGLVRYGLKNNLFKKPHIYYMNLEHQSANSESYELRGSYDGFSGSIYLGMVYFSNGKVSSIRWANY
ncbi:MAG: hypothetical protein IKW82_01375 [Bacteroidales bacterium]|jgi:hypothetical protein|nr:hypothetical protein [Bacteroidales bacterium]